MTISTPTKTTVPFAASGQKNAILIPSQSGGTASFTDGFPPLTMTPKSGGGIPPSGKDMNGILFTLSQAIQYEQAGGHFPYDSSFASTVGGYPVGAIVQCTNNSGFWINGTANNTTDPEAFGAGWLPLKQIGATTINVAATDVTLTALQAAKDVLIITGVLTANINIIVPSWVKVWNVINNATMGNYSIIIKTSTSTVENSAILLSDANEITCNGSNKVYSLTYLLATKSFSEETAARIAEQKAIGWGQDWEDVSASRTTNETYTNTTGKPILVSVSDKGKVNNGLEMYCNDVSIGYFNFEGGSTNSCITGIIPAGGTYIVYKLSSSGSHTTTKAYMQWAELR